MIISLYAAVLGLIFSALSFRTIALRRRLGVALGGGENRQLERAIRAHGNFVEYVPLNLFLLFLLESSQKVSGGTIHWLATLLVLGRVIHALGLSQVKEPIKLRVLGTVLTQTVLIGTSFRLLLG